MGTFDFWDSEEVYALYLKIAGKVNTIEKLKEATRKTQPAISQLLTPLKSQGMIKIIGGTKGNPAKIYATKEGLGKLFIFNNKREIEKALTASELKQIYSISDLLESSNVWVVLLYPRNFGELFEFIHSGLSKKRSEYFNLYWEKELTE